jgi:hypothetical protein
MADATEVALHTVRQFLESEESASPPPVPSLYQADHPGDKSHLRCLFSEG